MWCFALPCLLAYARSIDRSPTLRGIYPTLRKIGVARETEVVKIIEVKKKIDARKAINVRKT